ncbi:MAG: regulatory protein [Sphingobacteriales bacterium]|jgi:regulatory protein
MFQNKRKYTLSESIEKIKGYCALQERSHKQVRQKLQQWGCYQDQTEAIITELIIQNYLSEDRFAEAIVLGKSRMKGWGRKKIEQWLKREGVSTYSIQMAFKELDEDEYYQKCLHVATKKNAIITAKSPFEHKTKLLRFLYQKGYEMELINTVLDEILE